MSEDIIKDLLAHSSWAPSIERTPERMNNGQVLLPSTWGNYTPKTPPAALAASTGVTGEPISPRTAQYRPLEREVARAYGTRRGSERIALDEVGQFRKWKQ